MRTAMYYDNDSNRSLCIYFQLMYEASNFYFKDSVSLAKRLLERRRTVKTFNMQRKFRQIFFFYNLPGAVCFDYIDVSKIVFRESHSSETCVFVFFVTCKKITNKMYSLLGCFRVKFYPYFDWFTCQLIVY